MKITINKDIVSRYKAEGLSAEYIGTIPLVLSLLNDQDFETLDALDDGNKEKRMMVLYQYMNRKKLLEEAKEDSVCLYQLTEKGMDLIRFIEVQEDGSDGKVVQLDELKKEDIPISEWISEYIDIFPKEKILGVRYLRTNDKDCTDRMEWFMKVYKYDRSVILQATRAYIEERANGADGHNYTRNSSYFIFKGKDRIDRSSDLATWCKMIVDGEVSKIDHVERDIM